MPTSRGSIVAEARCCGASDPEVEASLQDAFAVAREQYAKGWEISAAAALARLWGKEGRRAEAHDLPPKLMISRRSS